MTYNESFPNPIDGVSYPWIAYYKIPALTSHHLHCIRSILSTFSLLVQLVVEIPLLSSMSMSWFVLGFIPLVRPAVRQLSGGCKFAGVAKHIELQLRIKVAHEMPPKVLRDEHLVDQEDLKERFESSNPEDHQLSTLLGFVKTHGAKLKNGESIMVRFAVQTEPFAEEESGLQSGEDHSRFVVDELVRWLGRGTLLGTMVICDDYPTRAECVYLGLGKAVYRKHKGPDGKQERILATHTVVILGLFHVDSSLSEHWRCPEGRYFEYQDSRGSSHRGLLGHCRTIGHPRVLLKVYQAPLREFNPTARYMRGL